MFGGLAIAGNLLCIAYSDGAAQLILWDLEDDRLASRWSLTPEDAVAPGARRALIGIGGVAMDRAYNIYVADTAHDRVLRFTPFGRQTGVLGLPPLAAGDGDEPGANRRGRDRRGFLDHPNAVCVADERVFVACGETKRARGVQRLARDGGVLDHVRAFGESDGRFGAPRGLAADPTDLWVADTLHGCVQRFRLDGGFVHHFSTATRPGEASRPVAVQPLPGGEHVLVCDAGDRPRLTRFTLGGVELPLPDAVHAQLVEPSGLALDAQGLVHVLDRDGERVVRLGADFATARVVVDLLEVS